MIWGKDRKDSVFFERFPLWIFAPEKYLKFVLSCYVHFMMVFDDFGKYV